MKYIKLLGIIFTSLMFTRCSKDDAVSAGSVTGEWAFTNQFSQSFAYPSFFTNTNPVSVSSWSVSSDSIRVHFDNNGNYSFSNYRLPSATGKYKIVQDSMLVIQPDTSAFIKFCYSTPNFYAGSGTTPPPLPYSNYHFTSDTIYFKKSGNNIVFTTFWLNRAYTPLQPSLDTLILTRANSGFKKL